MRNQGKINDPRKFRFVKLSSYSKQIAVFRTIWNGVNEHVVYDKESLQSRINWLKGKGFFTDEEDKAMRYLEK